jgi:hypothetical protein
LAIIALVEKFHSMPPVSTQNSIREPKNIKKEIANLNFIYNINTKHFKNRYTKQSETAIWFSLCCALALRLYLYAASHSFPLFATLLSSSSMSV